MVQWDSVCSSWTRTGGWPGARGPEDRDSPSLSGAAQGVRPIQISRSLRSRGSLPSPGADRALKPSARTTFRSQARLDPAPIRRIVGDVDRQDAVDKWAAWLLHRRDGDDDAQRQKVLEDLRPIRQRVLDNARIAPGDVVLDVGAGDGLIAFGALDRVGPDGHIILSDVSKDLVRHARSIASDLGVEGRMSFVEAAVEDLAAVSDASVDVVTTRSVLIYVEDKSRVFREFHRVLRSGGRVSIFEPINNYFPSTPDEYWGFDARPVRDLVTKVWRYEGWTESSDADDPMMNFSDKDLVRFAEDAGFSEIHVELLVDVKPGTWVVDWERLLNASPNPNAHTAGEALRGALTPEEFDRVERQIRPLADAGAGTLRLASAYLSATKALLHA
jgi:arsenite methyltransferase